MSANVANITRTISLPEKLDESKELSHQPESLPAKTFMKAPHEFFSKTSNDVSSNKPAPDLFPENIDPSSKNTNKVTEIYHNQLKLPKSTYIPDKLICLDSQNTNNFKENFHNELKQPKPTYIPDKLISLDSQNNTQQYIPSRSVRPRVSTALPLEPPDIANPVVSNNPSSFQNVQVISQSKEDFRPKSMGSLNPNISYQLLGSSPSANVQVLIGIILLTLNTLKLEKMVPTESNINDCIHYGDPKFRKTNIKKALYCALEQQMIVKHRLGQINLYLGRNEKVWNCENPIGGYIEQYPEATWVAIKKFLSSSTGRSAIFTSECRYEAALILKKSCLKTFCLGEVPRIFDMIINLKKWIKHAEHGWQPITITFPETNQDVNEGT